MHYFLIVSKIRLVNEIIPLKHTCILKTALFFGNVDWVSNSLGPVERPGHILTAVQDPTYMIYYICQVLHRSKNMTRLVIFFHSLFDIDYMEFPLHPVFVPAVCSFYYTLYVSLSLLLLYRTWTLLVKLLSPWPWVSNMDRTWLTCLKTIR